VVEARWQGTIREFPPQSRQRVRGPSRPNTRGAGTQGRGRRAHAPNFDDKSWEGHPPHGDEFVEHAGKEDESSYRVVGAARQLFGDRRAYSREIRRATLSRQSGRG
jgi:hypothetical protein